MANSKLNYIMLSQITAFLVVFATVVLGMVLGLAIINVSFLYIRLSLVARSTLLDNQVIELTQENQLLHEQFTKVTSLEGAVARSGEKWVRPKNVVYISSEPTEAFRGF